MTICYLNIGKMNFLVSYKEWNLLKMFFENIFKMESLEVFS